MLINKAAYPPLAWTPDVKEDANQREYEAAAYYGLVPDPDLSASGGWYELSRATRAVLTGAYTLKGLGERLNGYDYRMWRKRNKIED